MKNYVVDKELWILHFGGDDDDDESSDPDDDLDEE